MHERDAVAVGGVGGYPFCGWRRGSGRRGNGCADVVGHGIFGGRREAGVFCAGEIDCRGGEGRCCC